MANQDYVAKAVIETKQSQQDLTALGQAAKTAGSAFAVLDKGLKDSNTNLKDAAQALKSVVESTRQGAIAAKALADAEIKQARTSGTAAKNADAHALSEARRTKELELGRAASERRSLAAQNDARAAQRATEATERHSMALQRHTATQERQSAASTRAAAASLEVTDHLSNSRYLLYDVSATYQMLATAMLAIPAAATAVAISYEKDMAQVIRTNDAIWGSTEGITQMKDGLKDLASEIPVSFGELANIASIGGQLGIASSEMLQFTETVAKFGAASNVTTEQAATAFGRLKNAFPKDAQAADFFNKIGSSIAYVGVKSVATETEIIAVVNQLSALAAQSGFTAEQVVGLSGALASVRIRPELARGAFLSTMTKMTNAADEGATAFYTYSKYLDMAGAEGKELFESNPGEFFQKFIDGIAESIAKGQSFSSVMADLGVKEKRETQFLLGLANGHEVYAAAAANSAKAHEEGTFLDDSTARVFSTVSAELQKLANNFQNLGDTLGGGSMNLLAEFLRLISGAISGISDLAAANSGVLKFINSFLGIGAVIGVLLAFKAAQAAALAAVVAYRQVVGANIQQSISMSGVLKELVVTTNMAKGATLAQSQAYMAQNGLLKSLVATKAQLTAANGASAASANTAALANINLARGTMGASTAFQRATASAAAFGTAALTAARGAGTAMLGLVGGPIGALVLSVGVIAASFFAAGAAAKESGKLMAEGMAAGLEEGRKAATEQLDKLKVGITNSATTSSQFTDMGKSLNELGDQAGIARAKMVDFATGVKGSEEALKSAFDEIAQGKGYLNFDDWDDNGEQPFDAHLNNLRDIRDGLTQIKESGEKGADNLKKNADAIAGVGGAAGTAAPAVDEFGDGLGGVGEDADKATSKITGFIDALFGLVNAEAASAASLEKLGAGLQDSTSFGTQDEGGRDNLANLQETLRNAALMQQQMTDSGQQTIQQAQANYVAFVDALYADLTARGVDPAEIQAQVDAAKNVFNTAVNDANANDTAAFKAKVDTENVKAATAYLDQVVATYGTTDLDFLIKQQGGEQLVADVEQMSAVITDATDTPYEAKVNAEVMDAVNNVSALQVYTDEVTGAQYVMVPEADVNPALAALQFLQRAAANVVNGIIAGINGLGRGMTGVMNALGVESEGFHQITPVGWGQEAAPSYTQQKAPTAPKAPTFKAPTQTNAAPGAKEGADDLSGLANGYNNAAKAADKAGGAGKQAGKDMADGIEDAQKSLDDYVSRLKSGLTEAYDRQYGMATATDNYYKALNAITDKRKEDLKSIQDLITAQKELNNERNKDLIDANKAKIEKNISIKYGETDRAADYANQEQTALDNAAAKQKDIAANIENRKSLELGMNALTGYSNAAIANRAALRDVESKMLDMIVAYAATGKSQQQVAAYANSLSAKFRQQTGDIGYNRTAVNNLQGSMQRYVNTVNSVPRVKPTTVTANTAGANSAIQGVKNNLAGLSGGRAVNVSVVMSAKDKALMRAVGLMASGNAIAAITILSAYGLASGGQVQGRAAGGQIPGFSSGGQIPGRAPSDTSKDNRLAKVDGKGLIGIQSEEWVVQKAAVDFYGNDFMDDINNMRLPKFAMGGVPAGYSARGGQSNGDMIVALDAETMAKFAQFMNQPTYLFADAEVLASTVHKGGEVLASKGVRN